METMAYMRSQDPLDESWSYSVEKGCTEYMQRYLQGWDVSICLGTWEYQVKGHPVKCLEIFELLLYLVICYNLRFEFWNCKMH